MIELPHLGEFEGFDPENLTDEDKTDILQALSVIRNYVTESGNIEEVPVIDLISRQAAIAMSEKIVDAVENMDVDTERKKVWAKALMESILPAEFGSRSGEWFGRVEWSRQDIITGYEDLYNKEPNEDLVNEVMNRLTSNDNLQDTMIEAGWNYIYNVIEEIAEV